MAASLLTPELLPLFQAREPLVYIEHNEPNKCRERDGMAEWVSKFEDPKEQDPAIYLPKETRKQRAERISKLKKKALEEKIKSEVKEWNPKKQDFGTSARKTLFVARLNYETTESRLRNAFEMYGPIKTVTIVKDKEGKPKGYAFLEFGDERDCIAAYKYGNGKNCDGRNLLIDVERGRTQSSWKPRRLGGGLGFSRYSPAARREIERAMEERRRRRDGGSSSGGRGGSRRERDRGTDRDRNRERERERERERGRDRGRGDRDRKRERYEGSGGGRRDAKRDRR